ncbi:cardiolipin synthase ClsB [Xylophilus sp.]|uniref:cardiolipin synthase ClsB n=1 Tax=Xylophilus sp. TaxID=2653893 RepID=UPI0013BCA32A|nr:cardiolipin synthase ClsB [Xylophilus sp.]KAF1045430.1 MAG: Cardiolipin synthase B [Xylophilus sp.]
MASSQALRGGHRMRLLQGSAEYFAALVAAMDAAKVDIALETYIFDCTGSAAAIAEALMRAARRGVQVRLVVDGVGTGPLPEPWRTRLAAAGVQCRVYSPPGPLGLLLPRRWRRLHRKLCVVDGCVLFCGGINVLDDFHDPNHGALAAPRLDFAVEVAAGPAVAEACDAMDQLWWRMQAARLAGRRQMRRALAALREAREATAALRAALPREDQGVHAALVLRDNVRNRRRIERVYLRAIGRARAEVTIANAYFIPGGRLLRALVAAARRGVRVRLLLQGRYEYFLQYHAARPAYGALLAAGVEIHEYAPSFLHAKVAVVDGRWATVGSSNLDPLSLLLAREANVVVRDAGFAADLRARLQHAIEAEGVRMEPAALAGRPWRQRARDRIAWACVRLALFVTGNRY